MVGEKPLEPVHPEFYFLFTSVGLAKSVSALSNINISSIISISSKKVSSFLESVPQQIYKAYRAIKKVVQPLHSINVNIGENIQKETSQTYIQGKMELFVDSMRNYIIAL